MPLFICLSCEFCFFFIFFFLDKVWTFLWKIFFENTMVGPISFFFLGLLKLFQICFLNLLLGKSIKQTEILNELPFFMLSASLSQYCYLSGLLLELETLHQFSLVRLEYNPSLSFLGAFTVSIYTLNSALGCSSLFPSCQQMVCKS